ncbi:helix-turn-helix domain-containing protein [Pontibacter flavimaris]|uniref:Helix-turn-helix domain-containing protein n=1 Tax=Pontibacter flavimaris TaxID=1797110 RepID=A0A1Q5PDH2_9BACT|nr:helix-turn-helix domain-containing protein [Pontibacter flavimaris]OKL40280.1 hypothetical protein A3841_18315 [Pontibacter flavimaris]
MIKITQIENLEAKSLLERLRSIESKLEELISASKPGEPTEYLTRQEVAELFKVSLPTVHSWTNKGLIKSYKIANKTRFKRSEVEAAAVERCPK